MPILPIIVELPSGRVIKVVLAPNPARPWRVDYADGGCTVERPRRGDSSLVERLSLGQMKRPVILSPTDAEALVAALNARAGTPARSPRLAGDPHPRRQLLLPSGKRLRLASGVAPGDGGSWRVVLLDEGWGFARPPGNDKMELDYYRNGRSVPLTVADPADAETVVRFLNAPGARSPE